MKYRDLDKFIKKKGFKIVSQRGSHVKYSDGLKTIVVPNHGSKDIATGTVNAIIKQASYKD